MTPKPTYVEGDVSGSNGPHVRRCEDYRRFSKTDIIAHAADRPGDPENPKQIVMGPMGRLVKGTAAVYVPRRTERRRSALNGYIALHNFATFRAEIGQKSIISVPVM